LEFLQTLCVSNMDKPIGSVLYTQMCNSHGGIEADVTFIRLSSDHFYMVTGSGFGVHDSEWLKSKFPMDGTIHLIEVTSGKAVINVVGPQSRDLLSKVSESDVSGEAIPFATAKEIIIGAAPVLASRIGYVGELGFELHIPSEFAIHVYKELWQAGQEMDIANVGYRAIESLRMEKGYLYWSGDISPDYSPLEAGLGFRVHFDLKDDFLGRQALESQMKNGLDRKLFTFISEQFLPLTGGETILESGRVVSLATSVAYGFTVKKTIIRGYLDRLYWGKTEFTVEVFGQRYPVKLASSPVYDPKNLALKG